MRVERISLALLLLAVIALPLEAQQRRSNASRYAQRRPQPTRQQQQQQRVNVAARPQRNAPRATEEKVLSTIFSQIVMDGLDNPCGMAIQPKTNHVFIAEGGSGRVGKLHDVPGEYRLDDVIVGFPQEDFREQSDFQIGPLGLAFLDRSTLLVGGGGQGDGEDILSVYRVPHTGKISADDTLQTRGPAQGQAGNLFGIAANESFVYAACNGDETDGFVVKSSLSRGALGELESLTPPGNERYFQGPTSILIGRRGEILVGQMGSFDIPGDSRLVFINARTGQVYLDVPTELNDMVGLAMSPKTGRVYACDFSAASPQEGGLYRLDMKNDAGEWICKPTLLMPLRHPAALAFTEEGELFVATFASHAGSYQGGLLVRIYAESRL